MERSLVTQGSGISVYKEVYNESSIRRKLREAHFSLFSHCLILFPSPCFNILDKSGFYFS